MANKIAMPDQVPPPTSLPAETLVSIDCGQVTLEGRLIFPRNADGVVLYAHGASSGRHNPRNHRVAAEFATAGMATLLVDLLTEDEEAIDQQNTHLRFDIGLLAERLCKVTRWLTSDSRTSDLPIGYFASGASGGAALVAAVKHRTRVGAVVLRSGQPDLAEDALPLVQAPTLLIVGAKDLPGLQTNEDSMEHLGASVKQLAVVCGASYLFEEPGKQDEVCQLAIDWFARYLDATNRS